MAYKIYDWEIAETLQIQRILKALKHEDAEIIKSDFERLYAINYSNKYFTLHVSREELISTYTAAKKYKYFSDIPSKIMAALLGANNLGERND